MCNNLNNLHIDLLQHPQTLYDYWMYSIFANQFLHLRVLLLVGATFELSSILAKIAFATCHLRKVQLNLILIDKADSLQKLVNRNRNLVGVRVAIAEAPDRSTVLKIGKQAPNMFEVYKNLETVVFEYGLYGSRAMEEVRGNQSSPPVLIHVFHGFLILVMVYLNSVYCIKSTQRGMLHTYNKQNSRLLIHKRSKTI